MDSLQVAGPFLQGSANPNAVTQGRACSVQVKQGPGDLIMNKLEESAWIVVGCMVGCIVVILFTLFVQAWG